MSEFHPPLPWQHGNEGGRDEQQTLLSYADRGEKS